MLFPFKFMPKASYKGGHRYFGAPRDHGRRKHAGCDLLAPVGTPVFAVAPGIIITHKDFYLGTWYLAVDHDEFVVRYGEIDKKLPSGIRVGSRVQAGTLIAQVGCMKGTKSSMLHFEMYSGAESGNLTVKGKAGGAFQRRADLMDPTPYLDTAVLDQGGPVPDAPLYPWSRPMFV